MSVEPNVCFTDQLPVVMTTRSFELMFVKVSANRNR